MKRLTLLAFALSFSAVSAVHAAQPSPWFQTATLKDQGTIQREYIIPHSMRQIGRTGRVYSAYVRDTFDPPVNTGAYEVQAVLSSAVVDCDNLTWGSYEDVEFAPSGEPVGMTSNEINRSLTYWLPKDMGLPNAAALQTLSYICNGK